MTEAEKEDLAKEIYNEVPNSDIKKYIEECIKEGKQIRAEVKQCVLFKIAQRFKSLL